MPLRIFTDAQREGLSGFPSRFNPETLDRFFTLSDADLVEIAAVGARTTAWAGVAALRAAYVGIPPE